MMPAKGEAMSILGLILLLVVAAIIGFLADALVPGVVPFGWLGAIIVGLIGAWLGGALLGNFGPQLGGIYIIPAIIGAVILAFLLELILGAFARRTY